MRTIKNRNNDGRPKKSPIEKKSYRVEIRFDTADYYRLKSKAREAGMTLSEFTRNSLLNCIVKQRLNPEHLRHILKLTGMANNLNQIAKKANTSGYLTAKTDAEILARSIDNVIKLIGNDG